jgi:hypothetical protein
MRNYLSRILTLTLAITLLPAVGSRAGSAWQIEYQGDSDGSEPTAERESVSTLTNSEIFPDSPNNAEQLDDWFTYAGSPPIFGLQGRIQGIQAGTDYGTWIYGYLEAPLTGQYTFCIASADNSELLLSTNYSPSNEVQIAYEPGTGNPLFSGNDLDTRESQPISLVKGQKYYFDVYQQVGPGPGYVQVGWIRPDGVQELIPALHLAQYPYNYAYYFGPVQAPIFSQAGIGNGPGGANGGDISNSISLGEGQELLLPLDVIAQQPTTFVWKTNGVVVPGQNLSYFEIPRTPATYNGLQIQAIVSNQFGSLTSSVANISVTPDTTPPTVVSVDTAGSPDILEITYSKPVDLASATNTANYQVSLTGGGAFPITVTNISLSSDQQTVTLLGTFNFGVGTNYSLTVQNVKDQASTPNILSPNPTVAPFTLSAPLGTTYNFNSGLPPNVDLYGNAAIETSANPAIGGYIALTDAAENENGSLLLAARNNIDQAHISFDLSEGSSYNANTEGSDGGDGFSVNISANLPLGTFSTPQYGYAPPVAEPQFTVYFNSRTNLPVYPVEIGVTLNGQVLTNILAGTNFTSANGIPPITSSDGHWAPVDINLHRDGTLDLSFDSVIILTNFQTGWIGIDSAQVNFGAKTEAWYETHYISDLYVNFYEGYVGPAGLAANSVLGGTFPEGSTVQLVAVPTGAGPDTYQWYNGGVAISGATNRILTFPATVGSGGSFTLAISNSFSGFVSSPQSVIIQPNLTPPQLVSAKAVAGSINQIDLSFNQTLNVASALATSTYSSPYFAVNAVSLGADGQSVVLYTTQQRYGTTYPLTISGLEDNYASHNVLNTTITVVSGLSYDDEVLGDKPVRYYKLNEASGTVANTLTTGGDTLNTNGTYQTAATAASEEVLPVLGVPSLVPSDPTDTAVTFVNVHSNQVSIPNNGDINVNRGPWAQRTIELWFNANSFPIGAQPGDTAIQAQAHSVYGLWEEGGNLRDIGVYLWNPTGITNTVVTNPSTALLSFTAYNSTDDGPGSPFGLLQFAPVYITYPVTTNTTYHVVAVLDGDPTGTLGELRLYVNGNLVGRTTNGVGQIYDHNGSVHIAGGNGRSHLNVSGLWGYFDGTEQDVAIYNSVLSSNDILAHYEAGTGASLVTTVPPTLVTEVNPQGDPYQLQVNFNQPVSPATANNLANYVLKTAGGTSFVIQSAQLSSNLTTAILNLGSGSSFAIGTSYNLTVGGVGDILSATNVVATTNLVFTFASAGSVGIANSSSLGSQVVTENQNAQFSVVASGQTPYSYQWYYNNSGLPSQTNATLSFSSLWNSGGDYTVVVSNLFSSVTSAPPSVLTVLPDTTPPQLVNLRALAGTLNEIQLTFNKPVNAVTAISLNTYSIPTAAVTGLGLLGASISSNGLEVTLTTTPQAHGQRNEITITGLQDRSHVPNTLTTTAQFVSTISYRDEVLAEPGLVRYFTFDETNGSSSVNSLVSQYDISPLNIVGTVRGDTNYGGVPVLGVPGLVPNIPNDTAISFNGLSGTNRVELPNGADINSTLGPWYQISTLFAFKANGLPETVVTSTSTNYETPILFSDLQYAIYLYPTQTNVNNPSQANLVFEAQETSSDGAGSPWGGNTPATATYITYPITTNKVYNVAAVLDGNAGFLTGELRLYINGARVGTVVDIGAIYQNPNDPPGFSQGYATAYTGTASTINPELVTATTLIGTPLNGVIDEFAYINQGTFSDARIAQLYSFSQTNWASDGFVIVTNSSAGTPPSLNFAAGTGGSGSGKTFNLSWLVSANGYYLEYTTNLASGIWFSNQVSPATVNGFNVVTQAVSNAGNKFFRLRYQ